MASENAVNEYNTKFTQAIQLQDMLSTAEQRAKAEETAVADNARANMTVMMNLMKDSGLSLSGMDDSFQVSFTKELMKAGVSVDAVEAFLEAEPTLKVDATTTGYDAAGNQVISFFSYNNGDPKLIKTITGGGVKEATAADTKELEWDAASKLIADNPTAKYEELKAFIQGKTSLSDSDIDTLLEAKGIQEGGRFITGDYLKNMFSEDSIKSYYGLDKLTDKELMAKAKQDGFTDINKYLQSIYLQFYGDTMSKITQYRKAGYSDKEILKMM